MKYIKLYFNQQAEDWTKSEDQIVKTRIPAKQCEEVDIGVDMESKAFFEKMTNLGKSMICPDQADTNFQLEGQDGDTKVKYI